MRWTVGSEVGFRVGCIRLNCILRQVGSVIRVRAFFPDLARCKLTWPGNRYLLLGWFYLWGSVEMKQQFSVWLHAFLATSWDGQLGWKSVYGLYTTKLVILQISCWIFYRCISEHFSLCCLYLEQPDSTILAYSSASSWSLGGWWVLVLCGVCPTCPSFYVVSWGGQEQASIKPQKYRKVEWVALR